MFFLNTVWLIYLQYWEKTFNITRILIWYFSISNKIYIFILITCLVEDISGEIYVPSKYSQNIFTSGSWDVCSVATMNYQILQMSKIGLLRTLANYQLKINVHGPKLSLRNWKPSKNAMFMSLLTTFWMKGYQKWLGILFKVQWT